MALDLIQREIQLDLGKLADSVLAQMPWYARPVLSTILGFITPFSKQIGMEVTTWDKRQCEITAHVRRRVKNHLGAMHAGAIGTIAETAAGLVILRNLDAMKYRLEMKEVNAVFDHEAKKSVRAICELDPEAFVKIKQSLSETKAVNVKLVSEVFNEHNKLVATVRSTWKVCPWNQSKE